MNSVIHRMSFLFFLVCSFVRVDSFIFAWERLQYRHFSHIKIFSSVESLNESQSNVTSFYCWTGWIKSIEEKRNWILFSTNWANHFVMILEATTEEAIQRIVFESMLPTPLILILQCMRSVSSVQTINNIPLLCIRFDFFAAAFR